MSQKEDFINRKAAIDALFELYEYQRYIDPTEAADLVRQGVYLAEKKIEQLPSAHQEQQWILVNEQLPKIDMSYPHHKDYLVQYDSGYMDVASWSNVNRFWTDHVTEPYWNCVQFAKVIAWMPLPEPLEGEK